MNSSHTLKNAVELLSQFNLNSESPATLHRKDLMEDLEKVAGDNNSAAGTIIEGREKDTSVSLPLSVFLLNILRNTFQKILHWTD